MKIKLDENLPESLGQALAARESRVLHICSLQDVVAWRECFVVISDRKVRVRRP